MAAAAAGESISVRGVGWRGAVGGAENAGVENAGAITYGKPSEQKTLKTPGV